MGSDGRIIACRTALLVCTGDRRVGDELRVWLVRHDATVFSCDDAFDACATIVTHLPPPEIALIGTQWLDAEDASLPVYLRRAWPDTVIVLFGPAEPPAELRGDARLLACRTSEAIRELLADTPTAIVRRFSDGFAARELPPRPVAAERMDGKERTSSKEVAYGTPPDTPIEATEDRHDAQTESRNAAEPMRPDADATLTREELAALLEEELD